MLKPLGVLAAIMIISGCKKTPPVWVGPAVSLPQASHAVALPARTLYMVHIDDRGRLHTEIDEVCSTPRPGGLPDSIIAPAIAVLRTDGLSWMGRELGRVPHVDTGPHGSAYRPYQPLLDAIDLTREVTRRAVKLCQVSASARPLMLPILAADVRVPLATVYRVLYTMGLGEMRGAALLVNDHDPSRGRGAKPVGGAFIEDDAQSLIGDLVTWGGALEWRDHGKPTVRLSRFGPHPLHLGLPGPPKVALYVDIRSPFGAFVAIQDALAGADVFCVSPALSADGRSRSEVVPLPSTPTQATPVRVDRRGAVAVHLWSIPGAGYAWRPGESVPFVSRDDGARCSRLVEMERLPLDEQKLLKGLKKMEVFGPDEPKSSE